MTKRRFCLFLLAPMVLVFLVQCDTDNSECIPSGNSLNTATCLEMYANLYLEAYLDTLKIITEDFDDDATNAEVVTSHEVAIAATTDFCCCNDTSAYIDLSSIIEAFQDDTSLTQSERDDYIALNNWMGLVSPNAHPGTIVLAPCE